MWRTVASCAGSQLQLSRPSASWFRCAALYALDVRRLSKRRFAAGAR